MSGGLLPAPEPRRRGRPKGSTNRRAKDLKEFIGARYGASAAQQAAALCMVTPAELKAAGGSMARAQVAKAAQLVDLVEAQQAERDTRFRQTIRDEMERLLLDVRDVTAKEIRQALDVSLKRVREAGAGFTLKEALAWLASERAQLMPYTDQRQPLAIESKGAAWSPSVVVQVESLAHQAAPVDVEFVEVFEATTGQVGQAKSDDAQQGLEFAEEPPPSDAD